MNELIIFSKNIEIEKYFKQYDFSIISYNCFTCDFIFKNNCNIITIFDYELVDENQKSNYINMLKNCDIILYTSEKHLESISELSIPNASLFNLKNCKYCNLNTLVQAHIEIKESNKRLTEYIKDSFQTIIDSNLLEIQKKEIEDLNIKLQELSKVDHLTRLLNRRALMEAFEAEKKRALRDRWRIIKANNDGRDTCLTLPDDEKYYRDAQGKLEDHIGNFSCIMVDIDHFKKINDTYGHLTGDVVLVRFGELLKRKGLFRENDIFGRYGGEEFIILLPETNVENARIPANRLREAIKNEEFISDCGEKFVVTISLGVSEFYPDEESNDDMIKRADEALYYAKEHGRDQVCIYSDKLLKCTK